MTLQNYMLDGYRYKGSSTYTKSALGQAQEGLHHA